jgi:DNA-directed RNA polymerase specialized sigma24 family protein
MNPRRNASPPNQSELSEYCTTLHDRVVAVSRRTRSEHDARDIAQSVVEQFLRSPVDVMDKYPDPVVYASVRTGHAGLDFDRSQRKQRCEGTRLVTNAAGERKRARTYVSGDAALFDGDGQLFDIIVDGSADFVETIAAAYDTRGILDCCLRGLTEADRELLYWVDGQGMYITEVAKIVGQRRETLNRRLSKIRCLAQSNAAEFVITA